MAHTSSEILGAMIDGYNAGRSQFPGHTFVGAYGEADKAGYREGFLRSAFTQLFLDHIPRPIITDRDGIIVRA